MPVVTITDREFMQFQRFIYDAAGIFMANGKQALVSGRLAKRLAHYQLASYSDYLRLLESRAQPSELTANGGGASFRARQRCHRRCHG